MILDEAIKLQKELLNLLLEVGFNKYIASSKLGIEAMERIKTWRKNREGNPDMLLPGETEK